MICLLGTRLATILTLSGLSLGQAHIKGKWGPVLQFPVIPVAAYIVPEQPVSNTMLVYSASGNITFSSQGGKTQFSQYDARTGSITHREVSNTQHDMFCPGMSSLVDGRLIISGGQDAKATSIYHPDTNSFTRGPDMNIPRGYQTSVTLSNGKVFALGGSWSGARGGKVGELYDPSTNAWTTLPGADVAPILTADKEGVYRSDNHAWLFPWRDGSVFQAGPSKAMHWYGTTGRGSVRPAGQRSNTNDAMCAVFVMYDSGKIFSAGGAPDYTDSRALNHAHMFEIDQAYGAVKVQRIANMAFPRGFANAVVLPNGQVLITGGQRVAKVFNDEQSILTPELFNPKTKTFRTMADESIPRNYHSVSILLADGTVFSGGGGLCGIEPGYEWMCEGRGRPVDHPDGQIFQPPYLFNTNGQLATRPVIANVSKDKVRVGATLTVELKTADAGATFSLIRIGSVTHAVNSDQRRIALTARSDSTNNNAGRKFQITLPGDSGVLIPGYWFLFAMNSNGVPSVARTVQITI